MDLSQDMKDILGQRFSWSLENIPDLEIPVFIILDFSPPGCDAPLSIAFDFSGGPKCWMSEESVKEINADGPRPYAQYKQFSFEGRRFYPYSVQSFGTSLFEEIELLNTICKRLYNHVVWGQ